MGNLWPRRSNAQLVQSVTKLVGSRRPAPARLTANCWCLMAHPGSAERNGGTGDTRPHSKDCDAWLLIHVSLTSSQGPRILLGGHFPLS